MTNHDRRAQPRVEWTGEAVAAFGAREVRLRTCDLSIGGCSVETPWCPRTGERVGIVLQLDGDPIGAWAEVAWASRRSGASDERYRWGLRFLELEQDCRARLGAFVDHCLAVDMLDEMLRGARDEAPRPVPAFGPGEFDDIPTRIFQHGQEVLPGRTFFPVEGAGAFDAESTAEIDVEATLTSEVPHTRTVQVDIADLYADAATVEAAPRAAMTVAAQDQDPWGRSGPEPIAFDGGWDAPSVASSMGWDDVGTPAVAEFVIEPLAAEPSRPTPAARRPTPAPIADAGDPFWSGATSTFPARTPSIWPSPPAAPAEPFAGTPTHDPNAYAKAAPFDGPAMDAIAMPSDGDDYGFQASFEHVPVTTTRPAFEAPAFGAPAFEDPAAAAPAFEAPAAAPPTFAAPTFAAPTFAAPTFAAPTFAAPTFAAPTFAAPTFAAPTAPAFDVGLEGPGFDTQAFAQQPVAPPPFAVEAFAPTQAAPPVQAPAPAAAVDPHAFDPHAFDPHAFDPQAFAPQVAATQPRAPEVATRPGPTPAGPAPITGPHAVLEPPPAAPLSADDLLELKRKRVEALLSSVPRRADANKTTAASNAKDEKVAAKRPKARPVDADSGLKRLFDEALRDIKQGE